jgi:hypothetical protein
VPNEDDPTIMAMTTLMAGEDGGRVKRGGGMGWRVKLPLFLVFILLFIVTS